jgi:murein DD-endopeptidase MepM/ murein hydrolase activator NlpD
MSNINLLDPIDPNKIVLGTNHPFRDDNGIPNIEDIRSYAVLSMKPKNSNYIEIENGNVVGNSSVGSGEEIILTGYHTQTDKKNNKKYNFYSTNYTNDGFKNKDGEFEYEGFGIKNIDINFDANKIPQVSIQFYDIRGNVLNNFESKFAKMFQLPYPIFNLKIKGGFGPTIDYRLQKIRDDISIDDSGNYTINSKFIGDRFAPLSDLPLSYLQAVPYFNNSTPNVDDNIIKSFHELIINSKRLFEKINQEVESPQEKANQQEVSKIEEKITSLTDIQNSFTEENIKTLVQDSDDFKNLREQNSKNVIINYLDRITTNANIISFKEEPQNVTPLITPQVLTLTEYEYYIIYQAINEDIKTKNLAISNQVYDKNLIVFNSKKFSNNVIYFGVPIVPISIDYSELSKKIDILRNQLQDKGNIYANTLTTKLEKLVSESLGNTGLKIGNIFKLMFDDYNILMDKIFQAGNEGFSQNARYEGTPPQTYDKIGFPTVSEKIGDVSTLIYPGKNPKFATWPEVKLIEEFIDAFIRSQVNNLLVDLANAKNEDGSNKYIPLNPREVYRFGTNLNPDQKNPKNIYSLNGNPDVDKICELIYERFLIFTNINLKVTADKQTFGSWNNENDDTKSFGDFFSNIFQKGVKDTDVQKNLFLSFVQTEARNIAFALMLADDKIKNYFIDLSKQFNGLSYFTTNPKLSLSITKNDSIVVPDGVSKNMGIAVAEKGDDYITISNVPPTLINNVSTSPDIITAYMTSVNELSNKLSDKYRITKDNILYIPDNKEVDGKSDYYYESIKPEDEFNFLINLYDGTLSTFNFKKFHTNSQYPSLLEIPRGMLIVIANLLRDKVILEPDNIFYKIEIKSGAFNPTFRIIKNSNFYKYLINLYFEAQNPEKGFSYQLIGNTSEDFSISVSNVVLQSDTELVNRIREYVYTAIYISVNSREFTDNSTLLTTDSINDFYLSNDPLYAQYLKLLLPKVSQLVADDKKTLEEKIKGYKSQMRDNDVKLAIYKSFQVIYENYLYGSNPAEYQFKVDDNFKFIDRAYNNIGNIAVLDIKSLISDSQDTSVSLLTAISRLLSNNNFWFYPFQGFLTDTKGYNDLFKIDLNQTITTKPLFIAMYVGGLSSNPVGPSNSTLANDGILKNNIPSDFNRSGNTLNAFLVKYTGTQNQIVFSNFEHSTESLKNTDEGLKIQSEIISNANNSLLVPKGQSLLNVYQKQSYTSTVKIPFGNMGIQPTQYYYLEFIPIFEGLYIIYNVTHSINSDTQRLETTFKGYRLKKDVNPIVVNEIVNFIRDNFYTNTLEKVGIPSRLTNLTPQQIAAIESVTTRNDKVSGFKVTSTFLRKDGRVHGAIDIGTPSGTELRFTLPDTEFLRSGKDADGYGNYIVLRNHKLKKDFYFAHLQEISSELVNKVKLTPTFLLGKTGNSGAARTLSDQEGEALKEHLHFEVNDLTDSASRNRVDYNPYLKNLVLG